MGETLKRIENSDVEQIVDEFNGNIVEVLKVKSN